MKDWHPVIEWIKLKSNWIESKSNQLCSHSIACSKVPRVKVEARPWLMNLKCVHPKEKKQKTSRTHHNYCFWSRKPTIYSQLIDKQEQKQAIIMPQKSNNVWECVGTLLIPSQDLQELSQIKSSFGGASLQKHGTGDSMPSTLRYRLTKKLTGPAPSVAEADHWAD